MKKIVLIALCLSVTLSIKAQNISITSKYKPMTYKDYTEPLEEYWKSYKAFEEEIDLVGNWIIGLLGHNIDKQMRVFLNSKYEQILDLSTKLQKGGLTITLKNELKEIRQSIQEEIVNYNNRVAESNSESQYQQQEPNSNLGKSLFRMKQEFPQLRYIETTELGDRYQDGYTEDGIAVFFYLKNDIVIKECLEIHSDNNFTQMWFEEMKKTFDKYSSINVTWEDSKHYIFSWFRIHLIYLSNDKTSILIYEIGGSDNGITTEDVYEEYQLP